MKNKRRHYLQTYPETCFRCGELVDEPYKEHAWDAWVPCSHCSAEIEENDRQSEWLKAQPQRQLRAWYLARVKGNASKGERHP